MLKFPGHECHYVKAKVTVIRSVRLQIMIGPIYKIELFRPVNSLGRMTKFLVQCRFDFHEYYQIVPAND